MAEIKCNKCNKVSTLKNEEKYYGKKVSFKCTNPNCSGILTYKGADPVESLDETEVINKNKSSIAELQLDRSEHHEKAEFLLTLGEQFVGRMSSLKGVQIQIETKDLNISRKHCKITGKKLNTGTVYILSDHKSANGVVVNKNKLLADEEIILTNGDEIRIGASTLTFLQ